MDRRAAEHLSRSIAEEASARERVAGSWITGALDALAGVAGLVALSIVSSYLEGSLIARALLVAVAAAVPPLVLHVLRLQRRVAALQASIAVADARGAVRAANV